jgi:hypothetical protein
MAEDVGASDGEKRNARAAMARMEAKHGFDYLQPAPEPGPVAAAYDDWEWDAPPPPDPHNHYAPRPDAEPGSGFHFRFRWGFDDAPEGYEPLTEQVGFIFLIPDQERASIDPRMSSAEAAAWVVAEEFGVEEDIQVWPAGTPDPWEEERRREAEEQAAYDAEMERELLEEKRRRARMSSEELKRATIYEDIMIIAGEPFTHFTVTDPVMGTGVTHITGRGHRAARWLETLPLGALEMIRGRVEGFRPLVQALQDVAMHTHGYSWYDINFNRGTEPWRGEVDYITLVEVIRRAWGERAHANPGRRSTRDRFW